MLKWLFKRKTRSTSGQNKDININAEKETVESAASEPAQSAPVPDKLHFSGYVHSDQIDIYRSKDGSISVSCWNDGYPNPMQAGGYSRGLPEELAGSQRRRGKSVLSKRSDCAAC